MTKIPAVESKKSPANNNNETNNTNTTTPTPTPTPAPAPKVLPEKENPSISNIIPPGNSKPSSPNSSEPSPAPEIGPGWTVITKFRKTINKKGFNSPYKYYITPKNKIRLRSKVEVDRFLTAMETSNGDEDKAHASIKADDKLNGKGAVNTNDKEAASTNGNAFNFKATPKKLSPSKLVPKKTPKIIDHDPPPKKPPTTYLMYTSQLRPKILEKHPGSSPVEVSRILGGIWRALAETEKDKLKETYSKDLETYLKQKKEWELRNPGRSSKLESKKRSRSPSPRKILAIKSPTGAASRKKPKGTDWFEVEGFRDRRVNRYTQKTEYLIKWRGCPESSNTWEPSESLNVQDDAKAWWEHETTRRNNLVRKQKRIQESMKRLGLEMDLSAFQQEAVPVPTRTVCKRNEAPAEATHATLGLLEDETWNWDDASQVTFRQVKRIAVSQQDARELVTEARINGTPVVLKGHVGWANFALRWLRRKEDRKEETTEGKASTESGDNRNSDRGDKRQETKIKGTDIEDGVVPMEVSGEEKTAREENKTIDSDLKHKNNAAPARKGEKAGNTEKKDEKKEPTTATSDGKRNKNSDTTTKYSKKLLDLSDPDWYLDIDAMAKDIGDEEVPVVRKNYNESQPISGNILASKFFQAGWKAQKEEPLAPGKRRKSILYLHQWQFPLSEEAGKKLCHQSTPLPNHILGEDLLKYWLDRVKLDSPLQYLFMGNSDTMSKVHRDNGGLAISIAPITGEKECILIHRDDGHACLYNNQAPLDPNDIDLNAYPLLPHARIWKTTIKPGEILLMPYGTYHQCRNITPCLSYSRFHLDGVNLRAFLHSMMDGDAPELNQDVVIWNSTRELIDVVDEATDDKRKVDEELTKAVDALRALRNIAKEVARKLHIREMVKGQDPSSPMVSSSVNIDGSGSSWQELVDDVDICLHEFRYRFNRKIPSFKRRRSIGKKILALPAMPFRGKSKPSEKELYQGRNGPVVAFDCPTDRGFLALPKAPSEISSVDRKRVDDTIDSIVEGDDLVVRIEGRKCLARVTEVLANVRVAWMSFEDLPSLYNEFCPCDVLRTSSVGGSCLAEPLPEEIKPGKLFVCLMGKDEYRGVVQYVKTGRFFKTKLYFGNGYSIDKTIDPESILSVTCREKKLGGKDDNGNATCS